MHRARLTVIAAAGLASVVPFSGSAAGAPLERTSYHDESEFVLSDFCGVAGLDVHFNVVVDGRVLVARRGPGKFPLLQDSQHGWAELTNVATGASYTTTWDGTSKDASIVDNGDGTTLTVTTKMVGHFSFRDGDGKLAGINGGGYWSQYLYDFAGTPDDLSDDTVTFLGDSKVVGREDSPHDDTCPLALSLIG